MPQKSKIEAPKSNGVIKGESSTFSPIITCVGNTGLWWYTIVSLGKTLNLSNDQKENKVVYKLLWVQYSFLIVVDKSCYNEH